MRYFGSPLRGFWGGAIDFEWTEQQVDPSAPNQQPHAVARLDPLWDPWVDS